MEPNSEFDGHKRTMMIIGLSLIMGVVFFAGFVFVAADLDGDPDDSLISLVMAGFSVFAVAASLFIPPLVAKTTLLKEAGNSAPNEKDCLVAYQTQTIVKLALLEGAAFANLVAVMMEGQQWSFIIVAALVALMVTQLPFPGRVDNWVRRQMEMSEFEQQFGSQRNE